MQVDLSTSPVSAIQAFHSDSSTERVIESTPGFIAIKHKMGCPICDTSASHCMAAKRAYEICLAEKDISKAVADTWPELGRYQDDYYCVLEDYNVLKESIQSAKKKAEEATIKNLVNQIQSLEKQLQETMDNFAELPSCKELEYYQGKVQYTLYGKDAHWATQNGYRLSDIPVSDSEDDNEDLTGLPTLPEEIPQDIPSCPPTRLARSMSKTTKNTSKVVHEAGIPAIRGICASAKQKRIIADPPASITGVLPKPLGKVRAKQWDQPTLQGASDWVMESDSPDHTAVIFCINEYARSLLGLPKNLVARHDDPNWMMNVIQTFNVNPSGIPQNLCLEGLHINVDDADVWYWLNLIKPKHCSAEAENLLQSIFSTVGKWDQIVTGQWKRNDSPFLCSPVPARDTFAYWLGCDAGVTSSLAREKIEPYFICHTTKLIKNKVTLHSQLQANEITLLKGGSMNQFYVHEDLLPLVWESPFYFPPNVGEPMDQDESDPEPTLSQPTAGLSSLADRLDYGKEGSFSCPPVDAQELQEPISYFDSLVPKNH
ncbi:hypothetical protein M422DRAFT_259581 [Sphaerobolus stellatus SS14]|uniref:Uncharacterized protein n=1 Tax=Sphaerobolus stellatus (strain SS14) TaxID=990650 RepID=A0A0C9V898_SPHS4|nr:hypothetical protein M422DRAFT_259581 [Sphaerobolus stellatus SS14]